MIVVLKQKAKKEQIERLTEALQNKGVEVNPVVGKDLIILGLVGDTSRLDPTQIEANRNVERVMHVAEPFKKANKMFHPEPTIVDVKGNKIGGKKLAMIAGPCSVESEEQIVEVAKSVKSSGANFLRGGAFKPRTSPYAFQGLKYEGLELLKKAKAKTGLPIVTELMSPYDIETFVENCIKGIEANEIRCNDLVNGSIGIVTALAPVLGYEKAAYIAKKALNTERYVKDVAIEECGMQENEVSKILNIKDMINLVS